MCDLEVLGREETPTLLSEMLLLNSVMRQMP